MPNNTTIICETTSNDVAQASVSGTVSRDADILEIDTYRQEVALNGLIEGTRSILDTMTDWIHLAPGVNVIRLVDEGNANSTAIMEVYYRSGWLG